MEQCRCELQWALLPKRLGGSHLVLTQAEESKKEDKAKKAKKEDKIGDFYFYECPDCNKRSYCLKRKTGIVVREGAHRPRPLPTVMWLAPMFADDRMALCALLGAITPSPRRPSIRVSAGRISRASSQNASQAIASAS